MSQKLERIRDLLAVLEAQQQLRRQEYGFAIGMHGGVLVEKAGHARGLWRYDTKGYGWTPSGYNQPICHYPTAEAAVRHMLVTIAVH